MSRTVTLLYLIIISSIFTNLLASNYYISLNGSDENNGTLETPFKTLTKANQVVHAGDTVLIREGTYFIDGYVILDSGGIEGKPVTYKPFNNESVILEGGCLIVRGDYIDVIGLECRQSSTAGIAVTYPEEEKRYVRHVRILNCHVHHNNKNGIYCGYYTEYITLSENNSHDNGLYQNHGYGIYAGGDNHIIEKNILHHNRGYGLQLFSKNGPTPDNNIIRYNICYENGSLHYGAGSDEFGPDGVKRGGGIIIGGRGYNNILHNNACFGNLQGGIIIYKSNDVKLYHNTCVNNEEGGIIITEDSPNVIIKNNICYQNRRYNLKISMSSLETASSDYNCWDPDKLFYWDSTSYDFGEYQLISNQDRHSIAKNPQFTDIENSKFCLQPNSPCIDAGTDVGLVFKGKAPDLGAYEFDEPTGFLMLSHPSPVKAGTYTIILTTSKDVIQVPGALSFVESDSTITYIPLTGEVPGHSFSGTFIVDTSVADGIGEFSLPENSLIDGNGNKGHKIILGKYVKIDKTSPSEPLNLRVR